MVGIVGVGALQVSFGRDRVAGIAAGRLADLFGHLTWREPAMRRRKL